MPNRLPFHILAAALFSLTTGCANHIHEFYATRDPAHPPTLGVGRYFALYDSPHYNEGSIGGAMETGLADLLGDKSVRQLRKSGDALRNLSVDELDAALRRFDRFKYQPLTEHNPDALVPETEKAIHQLAQAYNYDLVLCAHTHYSSGGLVGGTLIANTTFTLYDASGKRLGSVSGKGEDKRKWKFGFDARDPEYAQAYRRALQEAFTHALDNLRKEIDKR